MRKKISKTYKIGNLSVSLILDEFIFLYRGKNRVYLKKVSRQNLFTPNRYVLYGAGALCLVMVLAFALGNRPQSQTPTADGEEITVEDEAKKTKLLLSKETDYSEEKEPVKLVIIKHRVKKGQTLSSIAKKYGVSMDTICGCNGLTSYEHVPVGTVLNVPNKDGILLKLQKGQRIMSIANKYRVSINKIIAENNTIKNPDFFPANKLLFIPDAKPQNIFQGFLWPAASRFVTSGYGWRRHPINKVRHFHNGIDIKATYQWIRSTLFGKVTFTGWLGGYGKTVIIAHPGGWKSLYAHLSRISVRPGQYVKQGQTLGKSGNTGSSTGPHLHFELIKNGAHKNPYRYIKKKKR